MADPCPTCGRIPEPHPGDWLSPSEHALVAFLVARLREDREAAEVAYDRTSHGSPDREWAVRVCDLIATAQAIVGGYAWTRDRRRRLVLWRPLLILSAPYAEHPDYRPEWSHALGG